MLGFFGGFFAVPLNALIQHRPRPEEKGGVIAAANLFSFVGVFLAAGSYYFFSSVLHQTPAGVFLDGAILTLLATGYSIYLLPDSLLRLVLWMVTHSVYRIRVEGRDNIPESGGALFVSNHMSLVDALLLLASTDRHIRFLMFKDIYDQPHIKPFAKMIRAIPISSQLRPRDMIHSLREASDAIRNGEIVCIFAEGQITRIGQLLPFRRGMERIMKNVDAPIVPVNLDGVWGSIFSYERGRFLWKTAAQNSLSRHGELRRAHARQRHCIRSPRGRAGTSIRRLSPSQEPHEHSAALANSHRAPLSFPLRHGR